MNMAPLGLLPQGVTVDVEGSVEFEGKNLLAMKEQEKQKIRVSMLHHLLHKEHNLHPLQLKYLMIHQILVQILSKKIY